jgi:poly-gamma-glutamate capsule biosynthesis protein CapA/YwtB (metallophosphatase superfamily)
MNKEASINLLNKIYQSCIFGIDALSALENKISDMELQIKVNEQLTKYQEIIQRVEQEYATFEVTPPERNNEFNKLIYKTKLNVNDMSLNEIEDLASNIVKATNKEVSSLYDAINQYDDSNDNIRGIARDLLGLDFLWIAGLYYNYPSYFPH